MWAGAEGGEEASTKSNRTLRDRTLWQKKFPGEKNVLEKGA